MGKRKENIRGQLTIADFKVLTNEDETKDAEAKEYPIKIFVLEKREVGTKESSVDYKSLYDSKEVVFGDRLELFSDREEDSFRILDKVDYLFVLLTKEFFDDFSLVRILMDNCDLSKNSKLKLIIDDKRLRQHTTRIELYQKFKKEREELEKAGIINSDMQETHEVVENICNKIGKIMKAALKDDMWEDMNFQDKLTYSLKKDGRKISCKQEKVKEEVIKDRATGRPKESKESINSGEHYRNQIKIDIRGGDGSVQLNNASGNGTINAIQNNE